MALISGLMYSLLPTAIYYTGLFLSETLWIFFVMLSILLTYLCLEHKSKYFYILTGICYGISALIRPPSLPLAFLSGLLFYFSQKDLSKSLQSFIIKNVILPLVMIIISMFLTILPWTLRNYIVMGTPVFIDVNAGINLYLAHNDKSNGRWVDMGPNDPILRLGDTPEVNRQGTKYAIKYILSHPKETLDQAIKVHKLFWTEENFNIGFFNTIWLTSLYKLYSFKVLAILGILGVIISLLYNWHLSMWIILYPALRMSITGYWD